jgi:hypothetical protein
MRLFLGAEFLGFAHLILPVGVAKLGRPKAPGTQLGFSVSTLTLSVGLAVRHRVDGPAWGFALGSVVGTVLMIVFAFQVAAGRTPPAAADIAAPPPR